MLVDYTELELCAGHGGAGAVSFRREKFVPKGGPDGGDGGKGGNIFFLTNSNITTLKDIRYRNKYRAENGKPGQGSNKKGKDGKDIYIKVPVGTVIREKTTKKIIADLVLDNFTFKICEGGIGGKGNTRFKTSTFQTPRVSQNGLPGTQGNYEVDLKILADVGLVGLPNAGKSTLLSVLSSAKPKIGDYPFTTLQPQLGIVEHGDYDSFIMADIPGLIEGASKGKGLGDQFLKHIERNKVHIFLIESIDENPKETFKLLYNELDSFNSSLVKKPYLICRTKSDLGLNVDEKWDGFEDRIYSISSVSREGLAELLLGITSLLNKNI